MKRMIALLLALVMVFPLSACGKSKAAKAVDDMIAAVGEVTLESEDAILAAEAALEALSEKDADQVENRHQLKQARETYDGLRVQETVNAIAAIGTVGLDSQAAITAARALYDALPEGEMRSQVNNYRLLSQAEQQWRNLEAAKGQADKTKEAIAAIGEVTLESTETVRQTRTLYNGLPDAWKAQIDDGALKEAEAALSVLEAEAARQEKEEKKAALTSALSKLKSSRDKITGMTTYTSSQMPKYMNSRPNIFPCLILTDYDYGFAKVRYNYGGREWVFFTKVVIKADDKTYTKTMNYSDVYRDNGGGTVGEVYESKATASEIEILQAIVNSEETIVRFLGSNRSHDFTVSASDKKGIQEVLDAYTLMKDLGYILDV